VTLLDLYAYVRDGGTLAVLLLIIVGGMRGWYIWKREADEYRARITKLEAQLDRAMGAGERIAGTADRATRLAEGARSEASNG